MRWRTRKKLPARPGTQDIGEKAPPVPEACRLGSAVNVERLHTAIRDGDQDKVYFLSERGPYCRRVKTPERKRSLRRKLAITFETKREARQPFARRFGVG